MTPHFMVDHPIAHNDPLNPDISKSGFDTITVTLQLEIT